MDVDALFAFYDETVASFGVPPDAPSYFDPRLLLSERQLLLQLQVEQAEAAPRHAAPDDEKRWVDSDGSTEPGPETGGDGGPKMTSALLQAWADAGLFSWHHFETDEGPCRGVPLIIVTRLDLFRTLVARGWQLEELAEYAEWEDWVIEDCLGDEDLRYEDDDRLVVGRQLRMELDQIEQELTERLPPHERPAGWMRMNWSSNVSALSDAELRAKHDSLSRAITRVESLDLASVSPKERHRIGRAAFGVRWWQEFVRISAVERDRAPLRAGFSFAVQFRGPQKLVPDAANLDDFGEIDWEATLRTWRLLNDPDRWPLRLPGFLLVGGSVQLGGVLAPDLYAERVTRFRLEEYVRLFREIMGNRRCANCNRRLKPNADARRLYCSEECSQAARQRAYRRRQKAAVLRGGRESNGEPRTAEPPHGGEGSRPNRWGAAMRPGDPAP